MQFEIILIYHNIVISVAVKFSHKANRVISHYICKSPDGFSVNFALTVIIFFSVSP